MGEFGEVEHERMTWGSLSTHILCIELNAILQDQLASFPGCSDRRTPIQAEWYIQSVTLVSVFLAIGFEIPGG